MSIIRLEMRTKTSDYVGVGDLLTREWIFGQNESSIFVKDNDDNLHIFAPLNDSSVSLYNVWSSTKIQNYVAQQLAIDSATGMFISDGADTIKRGLEARTSGQSRWQFRVNYAETGPSAGSVFEIVSFYNDSSAEHLVLDIGRNDASSIMIYRPVDISGILNLRTDLQVNGLLKLGSSLLTVSDSSGFLDYTKLMKGTASQYDILTYNGTNWAKGTPNSKSIILTAAGGVPTNTNGCNDPVKVEDPTTKANIITLDFPQTSTTNAEWMLPLPEDFSGTTVSTKIYWTSDATVGNVCWQLQSSAFTQSNSLYSDATNWGGFATTVSGSSSPNGLNITSPTSLTIYNSPAAGKFAIVKLARITGIANDMTTAAKIISVKLEYTPRILV